MTVMNLAGVLNPIPTPFDRRGEVHLVGLGAALGRWLATPLAGFVILGSTGEAALLDEDESDRVIAGARAAVPADRTFIVGTGRESTRAAIAASKRAAALGADAVLVRTPGFYRSQMTTDAFVRHYTAVADASPVPVLLYNFTAVTGVTIPVAAVATLSLHPNIPGMKESNGDVARIGELVAAVPESFSVITGSASTFLDAINIGARGGILALSAVLPDACVRLLDLARTGREEQARPLQARLLPLAKLLGATYGIAGLKAALKLTGYDVGDPRPPLVPLAAADIRELTDALSPFTEAAIHVAS
jgi:4-hydroxy-2-oxoglutarate aldolase